MLGIAGAEKLRVNDQHQVRDMRRFTFGIEKGTGLIAEMTTGQSGGQQLNHQRQGGALGPAVLLLDMSVITTVLVVGYLFGTRVLKLDRETTLLTCAGSAICGAAAVLAAEATIRSRPAATSMAVATVVLFGSLSMLVYPLLYPLTGLNESTFGIYIGATVHEVAQVVAAGDAVGPHALANAVIVKLVRVMLLIPFLLILSQWWNIRRSDEQKTKGGIVIPWFAFGFVADYSQCTCCRRR
ncbi:putative sulfate exporter family transporter [Pseudomonas sp. ANT_H12B]|nr:putative sulfate exporter family transporter [Pseudomonas sp. ANT_H12B]